MKRDLSYICVKIKKELSMLIFFILFYTCPNRSIKIFIV